MFTDNLAYRTASHGVQAFVQVAGELATRQKESAELLECESYLQLGIDAFHWLIRADEQYRQAVFTRQIAYDASFDVAFEALCESWLQTCAVAERRLASLESQHLIAPNAAEFRDCVSEMRSLLAESHQVSGGIAALRDAASCLG